MLRLKMVDIEKVKKWIDDLTNYDYDEMARNLQKYQGDSSPSERQAMIEKCKVINEGKIIAYKNMLDSIAADNP